MRLLHGRPVAERINARTRERVAALAARGVTPTLDIVRVGSDPTASSYLGRIRKVAAELGVALHERVSPPDEGRLATLLGGAGDAHGVMLLTPLPPGLSEERAAAAIPPVKDVEGVHPENVGRLVLGRPRFVPSTAEAVLELLRFYEIPTRRADAVVIGRSPIVGRPAAALLTQEDATVTLAHSKTADIASHTRAASIVVVAIGEQRFLRGDMLSTGATVIDAGINVTPSGIVGDVDAESVASVAGALSPVPGGLGAVTTALLIRSVVTAAEQQS
ncbi:MAG TPA: bifunctional 5,10-methylenetetrahydrofolate dehydrogenase/5,10-methenyltetrahydrofolate cyclohydrolase [Candidatus Limnocylindria bacterium]|nr:bifunctional 5,10-methylenetetrahydrofolate dehydrogenase/5,10-methenyltetrahydrofolate cyclohydrolase [Candidatus Limnocylindria bacterium]